MEQLTVSRLRLLGALALAMALATALGAPAPAAAVPGAAAAAAARDTTISVSRGQRLVVQNFGGRLLVEGWSRAEVRIRSGRRDDASLAAAIRSGPGGVRIEGRRDRRHGGGGSIRVSVPSWLEIEVDGPAVDARVVGTEGPVAIRTLQGTVEIEDASGRIEARSVHGRVIARGVSGDVRLGSSEDDVEVRGAGGSLRVESVDGDVVLEEVAAQRVDAGSVDGDVRFRGRIPPGATVRLGTHDGDLTVEVDGELSARVSVQTYDGEFRSDFPVTVERFRGGEAMTFTVGDGEAELHLEAFDGDIELRRRRP